MGEDNIIDTIYIANLRALDVFAEKLADVISAGDVILLDGDVGAGKTELSRAVIRKLLKQNDLVVPSPTFNIVNHYQDDSYNILHYDLYRLADPGELFDVGLPQCFYENNLVIIEWPDILSDDIPERALCLSITTDAQNDNTRIITVLGNDSWRKRWSNMDALPEGLDLFDK